MCELHAATCIVWQECIGCTRNLMLAAIPSLSPCGCRGGKQTWWLHQPDSVDVHPSGTPSASAPVPTSYKVHTPLIQQSTHTHPTYLWAWHRLRAQLTHTKAVSETPFSAMRRVNYKTRNNILLTNSSKIELWNATRRLPLALVSGSRLLAK